MTQTGENGEMQIPAGWAFNPDEELSIESRNAIANGAVTRALQTIDYDIERLSQLRCSLSEYGFSKICPTNLTDATENDGLVLGATEKNESLEGTLANKIRKMKEEFSAKHHTVQTVLSSGAYVDIICYSINNVVFLSCGINSYTKIQNAQEIIIVPEAIRPKRTTGWIFAGYAFTTAGASVENQFLINAKVGGDGRVRAANDFGAEMQGLRISFSYTF